MDDLDALIMAHEPSIRVVCFVVVFAVVALLEARAPRRTPSVPRRLRWTGNLSLVALNTALLRLLAPLGAAGFAALAAAHGWGLLNHVSLPAWIAVPLAVTVLDFVIWLQHVMTHAIPLLWRVHRVHHADLDYDLTTGARFHPIEIAGSMLVKIAAISVLGPPVVAVVIFEVLLNATAMFNHANLRLPPTADRILRRVIVTPDMHRVHHSVDEDEANSNFGFNLAWWDRMFGTYRARPRAGHEGMTIGVREFREPREVTTLSGMLRLPFRRDGRACPIRTRGDEDQAWG